MSKVESVWVLALGAGAGWGLAAAVLDPGVLALGVGVLIGAVSLGLFRWLAARRRS